LSQQHRTAAALVVFDIGVGLVEGGPGAASRRSARRGRAAQVLGSLRQDPFALGA
jgi:hypothetical protein